MVEFRNVWYHVGGVEILRGIDLTAAQGETLVLLGRSGSGKTTLLKTVNRLVEPTRGEVLINGTSTAREDPVALRRRVGYVIQDGGLFPHWTVERNIGLVPHLQQWPESRIRSRVGELLELVGLSPAMYSPRYPRQLSGGEKQRVGIARALAADPALLLLDEPFSALDPITRFEMQRHFLELRRVFGKTVIFVTHDIREALLLGTRIALLRNGRVDTTAPASEFQGNSASEEVRAFVATMATHA